MTLFVLGYPDQAVQKMAECLELARRLDHAFSIAFIDDIAAQLSQMMGKVEDTLALAEHGIAKLKWPERLETVDAMPLTPTRKVIKGRLRIRDVGLR